MTSNIDEKLIISEKENIAIIEADKYSENDTKSPLLNLPDYIIETYIFPYLSWKELFFIIRRAHSYLQEIVKSTWCNIIKEEMCNQLKNLTFLYEKDALTTTYEFKFQYLSNYRNLLIIYYINANILNILEACLDFIHDESVLKLLATLFGILGQEQCLNLLFDENLENENKKNAIIELLHSEQLKEDLKNKMEIILDINSIESDPQVFKELNDDFNSIDREHVEEVNDNCRVVYSFLQGVLEYQSLKKNVHELKLRLEQIYIKIETETKQWPKRKKFFETAYKILLYSKSTTYKFRYMNKLFIKYWVKSPFSEYKEESYNAMIELKNQMENKKTQIIAKIKNNAVNNNENLMDEVNNILLENILDRRLLLTKKILLTEKFFDIINSPNSPCKKIDNEEAYDIQGQIINVEELLKTLILVSHACPDDISINSVLKLYQIKKKLEEVQIKENIDQKGTEKISKNEELNIEKKTEIILLKKQKENLLNQKKKTEKLLNVLKKYLQLKENFFKNKQKYKSILFVLNKMRKQNPELTKTKSVDINTDEGEKSIDEIEELLDKGENEEIKTELENLTKEEKEELQNFEVNEGLLKEIEVSIMMKIKKTFNEDKNNKITISNNNININEDMGVNEGKNKENVKFYGDLNIEKEININIKGKEADNTDKDDESGMK